MTSMFRCGWALLLMAACCGAGAAPTAPQVTAGRATFAQQGNVFSITNTPGTIINWQSFDIGPGEIARFIQQSAASAVLNRVTGQDPSRILGALQSNGRVYLINPNGILFGQGARVDVNGLVASTLNLADADFLAGRKRFEAGVAAPGAVRNAGAITTPAGGQVLLIAPQVENSGIVTAPGGTVLLAAGHSVQLVDSADPDVQVVLSAPAHAAVNLGRIIAAGGRVGIYGALVSQRGLVSADSAVVGADGRIVLQASRAATLASGSVTRAVGSGGADGGTVEVLGTAVGIEGGAQVDAGGRNGGTVLVGGDWQGGGSVSRAQQTTFAAGAAIRADATGNGGSGAGGKVVLWSDGATVARGRISARGAGSGSGGSSGSGSGGRVETSGHLLDIDGLAVDAAGGDTGRNGTWLLDPYDVEVVNGGTASAGSVAATDPDSKSGVTRVAPATLTAAGTDIVLEARHDLTVTDALMAAGSIRAHAGHDIAIDAAVGTRSNDATLDFRAGNAFTLGANATLTTGNLIYVEANRMDFAGQVAGANERLPQLSLTTADAALPIRVGSSGSGSGDGSTALVLDARVLNRLGAGLYELDIGTDRHSGGIVIDAGLTAPINLTLNDRGNIDVRAPVDLSANPASQFVAHVHGQAGALGLNGALKASKAVTLQADRLALGSTVDVAGGSVTLSPDDAGVPIALGGTDGGFSLGAAGLAGIKAAALTIGGAGGSGGIAVDGAVALAGVDVLTLDAGSGKLAIAAPLATGGTLVLASRDAVAESGGGRIDAAALAVQGSSVTLGGANRIVALAGSATGDFAVTAQGPLTIGTVAGVAGIDAAGVTLDAAGLIGTGSGTGTSTGSGTGVVRADTLTLRSSAGIGTAAAPLHTRTATLSARNTGTGGQPIDIANEGDLTLLLALQDGSPNTGSITIENTGALTVPDYVAGVSGEVRTDSGAIGLIAHGPLTIRGRVTTAGGNVRLAADGLLTVAPDAQVTSVTGRVSTAAAMSQIAPGTLRDVDSAPTATACLASPSAPGCGPVLEAAARACAATPDTGDCGRVLAQYAAFCASRPGDAACAVIRGGGSGAQDVQLAQAQQAAVQLIDTGTRGVVAAPGQQGGGGQDGSERTAGPAQAQDSGAKHDKPATKTYCD